MTEEDALCNACLVPVSENMTFYKCKFNGQGCNFVLHEWCSRLPAKLLGYIGHPQHTLLLLLKAGDEFFMFHCDACDEQSNGFAYSCVECNYNIQVRCAFMPENITHKSYPYHILRRFTGKRISEAYCRMCLSGFMDDRFETSFNCQKCDFHLHVGCALLLPEAIRHRYDKHPMNLAYSPVENHEGDYFCDVCEEELNPNACFYHCHECMQSIHTACAPLIPQSKPYIHGASKVLYRNIKYGGIYRTECHPHPLSFLPGSESGGDCTRCGKTLINRNILKCLQCKLAIHWRCCN